MSSKKNLTNKIDDISSLVKLRVKDFYSRFFLTPAIEMLLKTIPLEKEYGNKIKKIYPFSPETIASPELKEMPPFDSPFKYLESKEYTTHDIFTIVLEGVLFEPGNGVILTKSRKIIKESLYPNMDKMTIAGALLNKNFVWRKFFENPVETISGYSSIYQGLPNGYYHKLIDLIPRCYLLNQTEYENLPEIKLLYTDPLAESEKLLIPKLIPSNTLLNRLLPGRLYYLEKLILPTFLTQFGSGYLPKPYLKKLRDEFLPKRPSKRKNRIYISRAKSAEGIKKRHLLNEEALFKELKKFGFERYQLEDFSLQEKIELFYDAETVVGAYGGGLTHILFSNEINVLELQLMAKVQPYYYYLSKSLGHHYRIVFNDKSNNRENFSVDVANVVAILKEWHAST